MPQPIQITEPKFKQIQVGWWRVGEVLLIEWFKFLYLAYFVKCI